MSDIKRKRLSLKTKKSHFHENVQVDDDIGNIDKKRKIKSENNAMKKENKTLERIAEKSKEETIVRSSESAADDVICLSDEIDGSVAVQPNYTRTSLLDVEYIELRSLRENLLALHRIQPHQIYRELPPFPQGQVSEGAADNSREATPDTFLKYYTQEFSPLPQMCSACAKRKPLHCDFDGIIKSVFDGAHIKQPNFGSDEQQGTVKDLTFENPRQNIDKHSKSVSIISESNTISDKFHVQTETDLISSTSNHRNFQQSSSRGHQNDSEVVDSKKSFKTEERKTDKHLSSDSMNKKTETTDNEQASLSACPLCAMEFGGRTPQIEIDGHIAACLSSADDDVMW